MSALVITVSALFVVCSNVFGQIFDEKTVYLLQQYQNAITAYGPGVAVFGKGNNQCGDNLEII
jgi:hypothetical protein